MQTLRDTELRPAVSLIVLIASFAFSALSQTTSTEILGPVTDASGAVVPGANVSITRVALQQKARVNFVLEVEQVTETVEVAALAVPLQTEDVADGTLMGEIRSLQTDMRVLQFGLKLLF